MTGELDRLGDLVSTIGSERFGSEFYRLFHEVLDIEECTVFSFPVDTRPIQLVVEGACNDARSLARAIADDYVSGGYLSDPNVQRIANGTTTNVYIVHADEIDDQDYRRRYYSDPQLGQELVLMGRAGETLYYSSFYKRQRQADFAASAFDRINSLAGFILKTLHRHNELTKFGMFDERPRGGVAAPTSKEEHERTLQHMREILIACPHGLSPREAEVCAGIVMGYSALAISLNCGISLNTVATHRKRAYAKLGISSQNELFVRYFSTVKQFQSQLIQ